jgi:hypothetical protein
MSLIVVDMGDPSLSSSLLGNGNRRATAAANAFRELPPGTRIFVVTCNERTLA